MTDTHSTTVMGRPHRGVLAIHERGNFSPPTRVNMEVGFDVMRSWVTVEVGECHPEARRRGHLRRAVDSARLA